METFGYGDGQKSPGTKSGSVLDTMIEKVASEANLKNSSLGDSGIDEIITNTELEQTPEAPGPAETRLKPKKPTA